MQITKVNYNYNNYNLDFRGYSPEYICSQLCKGACCDHSTVMSASIKRATDSFLCDYYRKSKTDEIRIFTKDFSVFSSIFFIEFYADF